MPADPARAARDPLWRRSLWATSVGGLFSMGFNQVIGLVVPLYLVAVGMSPFWIGVVLAARSALSLLYAIHLGKVLDLIGSRRAMLGFSAFGAALSLTYPLFDSVAPLVVLQLLCGMAAAMCWMGSQAAITRLAPGEARPMAFFSFFASAGNFIGPLTAGYIWEKGGAWPAFVFMSAWLGAMFIATLCLPPRRREPVRIGIGLFVPRLESYVSALRLLAISAVRFVMCLTFLRIATIVMQESFYAVLLGSKGYPASTIGLLIGLCWLVSTPAALLTPRLVALVRSEERVLLASTGLSIVAIAVTPLLDSLPALVVAVSLFGLGHGLGFSLVIAGAARSFPPGATGLAVGLRATVNRAAGVIVPLVMGGVATWMGLDQAFWITGVLLLVPIGLFALMRKE